MDAHRIYDITVVDYDITVAYC